MAAYPVQTLMNGQIKWSDGSVTWPMSTNQGYVSNQIIPNTTTTKYNYQVPKTLGASTSSSSSGSYPADKYIGWDPVAAAADYAATGGPQSGGGGGSSYDPYAQIRNDISSGWDSYISSLDQQLSSLSDQRKAQEGTAQSQLNQGVNTLDLQKTQGDTALAKQRTEAETNQAKTLKDLSANIKNAFLAGNVYLGSRGAGDSSAANQYSYALTKMGTQQRSDVMQNTADIINDIAGRETDLMNIYNTEKNNLQESYNQQVNQIAQWFASAQQSIQQQKAQGALGKSQDLASLSRDILNQAMSQLSTIQQQAANRQSMLEQWAVENSNNINQLKTNLKDVYGVQYSLPQTTSVVGTPQVTASGGIYVPTGYGSSLEEQKKSLFG